MKKTIMILVGAMIALTLAACSAEVSSTADEKIERAQRASVGGLEERVGQPRIVNGTEMRLMNRIYELRDQPNLATFTYRSDMDGQLHCIGRSIGYGLPYSAQRSNPERIAVQSSTYGSLTLPQAEPNGLFMPDSAAATWVLLVGPNGQPSPVYVEDDVTVSTFQLQNVATPCR